MIIEEFYIFPEEVHRVGNSGSHKLSAIRVGEVDTFSMKGVTMVVSNGKGVSLFTLEGIMSEGLSGFAWKFEKLTQVEHGLRLVKDEKPGHYMLAPVSNMPVDQYKGLLEKMGLRCSKYLKIHKDGRMEAAA